MAGSSLAQFLQGQTPPVDAPHPEEWWRQIPPDQRDWWPRMLNNMGPNANPNTFQDGRPSWPHAMQNFDDEGAMSYNQPVTQEWMRIWGNPQTPRYRR